jgi:hypothetical protein
MGEWLLRPSVLCRSSPAFAYKHLVCEKQAPQETVWHTLPL